MLEDGGVVSRDLFDTKLMNCLTPRPAQVIAKFRADYAESPKKATDDYYNFSVATNYIRKDRIARDRRWKVPSQYGEIDITINLSKPEKDPKAIAAAKLAKQSAYPKCQLCVENEAMQPPEPSGPSEPPYYSDHHQWRKLGLPVFTVCIL